MREVQRIRCSTFWTLFLKLVKIRSWSWTSSFVSQVLYQLLHVAGEEWRPYPFNVGCVFFPCYFSFFLDTFFSAYRPKINSRFIYLVLSPYVTYCSSYVKSVLAKLNNIFAFSQYFVFECFLIFLTTRPNILLLNLTKCLLVCNIVVFLFSAYCRLFK